MRIVFDTNVLISAFLTTAGISQNVVSLAFRRHNVYLSGYILEEIQRKLETKLGIPQAEIEVLIGFLNQRSKIVKSEINPKISFSDKKDILILSLATAVGAHYLISGDKALLRLKKIASSLILSPREALKLL